MRLAHVTCHGRGATDALLAAAVAQLRARGLRLAGTVQTNPQRPDRARCDMDLRVLPDGPVFRISADRGDLARGCRLDAGALEQSVAAVLERLPGAQVLIVNKFGRHESEGGGMIAAIAAAMEQDIPVIVGVNALNLPAWEGFAAGLSTPLPPDPAAVADWATAALSPRDPAAARSDTSPA